MPNRRRNRIVALLIAIALVGLGVSGTLLSQHFTYSSKETTPTAAKPAPNFGANNWTDAWKVDKESGELTNGPGTIKKVAVAASDSDETKYLKEEFNRHFVDNPFFDCYDNRNAGKTWREMNSFTPCVNGSTHLRLADGKLTVLNTTDGRTILHNSTVGDADDKHYSEGNFDLTRRQDTVTVPTGETTSTTKTVYLLGYDYDTTYSAFEFYAKVDGGKWQLVINLNDKSWDADKPVEFLLTWQDPTKPMIDAPVPFNWTDKSLQKDGYVAAA